MRLKLAGLAILIAAMSPLPCMARAATSETATEQGTGGYPAMFEEDAGLPDHVIYRPRDMAALGSASLPVYVWGNGGCSADGTSTRNHLLEIASHGYLAIAAGTVPKAAPAPAPPAPQDAAPPAPAAPRKLTAATPTSLLTDAIDWAIRENARPGSPYQGRLAIDRIAVSGWSCGGLQALNVAGDPRVRTVVIMNSGFFTDGSPIGGIDSDKAMLSKLHTPVLYVLGGPKDIAFANGMDDYKRIEQVPAAVINIDVGHGGTYFEPHGGLAATLVTSWLDWQLKGDAIAGANFTGAACGYCKDARFTIERKRL